ncbi:hypothetical protein KAJ27_21430 [bacterium]|nr:hypothetical protein [bacterium]
MIHRKTLFIITVFLMCMNIFYGCGSLKTQYIEKQYYDLTTGTPDNTSGSKDCTNSGSTVLIKPFPIDPAFDSFSFIYRVDKTRYVYDYYNEFISSPAKLISDKIAETLYASPHFQSALTKKPEDIEYRLSGKIIKLYGNFQKINTPKAVIEIRILLEQKNKKIFNQVISKIYSGTQTISSASPDDLLEGWDRGFSTIMKTFIKDFKATIHNF